VTLTRALLSYTARWWNTGQQSGQQADECPDDMPVTYLVGARADAAPALSDLHRPLQIDSGWIREVDLESDLLSSPDWSHISVRFRAIVRFDDDVRNWPGRAGDRPRQLSRNLSFAEVLCPTLRPRPVGPLMAGTTHSRPRQEADRQLVEPPPSKSGYGDLNVDPDPAITRHSPKSALEQLNPACGRHLRFDR